MKRLRFTVDITAQNDRHKYKYLASILEEIIRSAIDFEDVFYVGNANVLKRIKMGVDDSKEKKR